jgi:hypothetical protein
LGLEVLVEPIYGYGWNQQIPDASGWYPDVETPPPFRMKIDRFFEIGGEIKGGLGTVCERAHELDSLRVSFSTRHTGEWDFASRIGHYNLAVGSAERETKDGWLLAVGLPALIGFGMIRSSNRE